jgi:hypothetical protein
VSDSFFIQFPYFIEHLIKLPGSLNLQPRETPGVITNWHRCQGEEKE